MAWYGVKRGHCESWSFLALKAHPPHPHLILHTYIRVQLLRISRDLISLPYTQPLKALYRLVLYLKLVQTQFVTGYVLGIGRDLENIKE